MSLHCTNELDRFMMLAEAARNRPLKDVRLLVVEDEYFIADDIKRALSAAGASVVGPVATLKAAQTTLAERSFDWAVVDLNLHHESAIPIAEALLDEGKPFVIATGYDTGVLPDPLKCIPCTEKPFEPPQLIRLLERSISARRYESAKGSYPQ